MKRVLSGMQPTNNLHLGNYLGALRNWVGMQAEYECLFCVVDLHAITQPYDPAKLAASTREIAAAYIAAGVDTNRCTLFVQSAVTAHSELGWLFSTITPMGWLNRMTQFKDKAGKDKEKAGLGLYAYPVLMAADILIYKATHVPVGDDQKQHVELTREIAGAFNRRFNTEYFTLPEPVIQGAGTRVMSLRDGSQKMSKSAESDMTRINLIDDPDTIVQKIKKARTDSDPITAATMDARPEARNLINIYAALSGMSREKVLEKYEGAQFSVFKPALADLAIEKLGPITARMRELMADPAEIDRILARGNEKAAALATKHLGEIQKIMGFWGA